MLVGYKNIYYKYRTAMSNNETINDLIGVTSSTSGRFSGTYLNTPTGTANNYNLTYVSGQLVITGCPNGPPCAAIGSQTTSTNNITVINTVASLPNITSTVISTTSPNVSAAPVVTIATSAGGGSFGNNASSSSASASTPTSGLSGSVSPSANSQTPNQVNVAQSTPAPTTNSINVTNVTQNPSTPQTPIATGNTPTTSITVNATANQSTPNPTSGPNTIAINSQPPATARANNNPNTAPASPTPSPINNIAITAQRLTDILNKKDPVDRKSTRLNSSH